MLPKPENPGTEIKSRSSMNNTEYPFYFTTMTYMISLNDSGPYPSGPGTP